MKSLTIRLSRLAVEILGLAMMGVGIGIILGAVALYAYGEYERALIQNQLFAPLATTSLQAAMPEAPLPPTATATAAPAEAGEPLATLSPVVTPSPTPWPPARRITIPAIDLDAPIVEAKIENGEWQVPKFVVGHLEGTANPGDTGNIVLSGHLESISSGNVFARLNELKLGDPVTLYAGNTKLVYTVAESKVVDYRDLSVVAPTLEPILTLITCTGNFDYSIRQYDRRLIVIARPVEGASPRNVL